MHRYDVLRRRSLYSFMAFLALSAVLAIAAVLSGEFGWLEIRVLVTTLTISGVSIDCMGCAAYLGRRGGHWLPLTGILLALLAGVLMIGGAWGDVDSIPYWKLTAVSSAFAVAATHACLLALAQLPLRQRWLHAVARGFIFLGATLIAVAIVAEIDSINYYKLLIIVTIIVALFTLVIPILSRITGARAESPKTLQLTLVEDDLYRSQDGSLYRLLPVRDGDGVSQVPDAAAD